MIFKIDLVSNLVNRCFRIRSSWSMFHQQLILLRVIFQKNGYLENFIGKCFKLFLNRIHVLKDKVTAVEKKPLRLVLPYLGAISLKTRTKLQKSIKGVIAWKLSKYGVISGSYFPVFGLNTEIYGPYFHVFGLNTR